MRSQHRTRSLVILFVVGLLLLPIGVSAGQAKNIILMIGDGMGPSQFGAAWLYSNRVLGKELQMVEVMKRSPSTQAPPAKAGRITSAASCARLAM